MADVLSPVLVSSGDVVIDRRFTWARESLVAGDAAGAADLLHQVLEATPAYTPAWFALGEACERLGETEAAIAAFSQALAHDPADRQGAALRVARLCGDRAPVPPEYVRTLYGGYAPRFEQSLVGALGYRAPDLLLKAVQAARPGARFGAMLDCGCGTGLAGTAFRPHVEELAGVDLSAAMLAKARAKGVYDRLAEAEAVLFLAGEAARGARYHLVVAADVLIYADSLAPFLNAAMSVLAPAGLVAFDVETHDGNGSILRDTLRYAHAESAVRAALAAAGLRAVSLFSAASRNEKGSPVPGLIVVAESA